MTLTNLCQQLHIDYISKDRRYWLVRTNGGQYFEDFYFDKYIGIEWDEIVSTNYSDLEALKHLVEENYPKEPRPGYVASQIDKFVKEFKKGDIVIIPNKNSKIFAIGEIEEDDIYITQEEPREGLLFEEDLETQNKYLMKRRKVHWLKSLHRYELDNRLQTFIYAHNTIVDLNNYSLFIDRTLSDFYIKGDEAFFTFRVNKTSKIPLDEMANLLIFNKQLCDFVNKHFADIYHIHPGEIISKIDVQSKGPVQLSGPIKKVLAIGLVTTIICGGSVKLNWKDGFEISSEGIVGLIKTAGDLYITISENKHKNDYEELKNDYEKLVEEYNSCKKELLLSVPDSTTQDITIEDQSLTSEDSQ